MFQGLAVGTREGREPRRSRERAKEPMRAYLASKKQAGGKKHKSRENIGAKTAARIRAVRKAA